MAKKSSKKGSIQGVWKLYGRGTYKENIDKMREEDFVPAIPATTSESILIASKYFSRLESYLFKNSVLQAGDVVITQEGVFTNTRETDESELKRKLANARKVNGIYLIDNDVAFASFETFKQGKVQTSEEFAKSGLARALEHTTERIAPNLKEISAYEIYDEGGEYVTNHRKGVLVSNFKVGNKPIVSVVGINTDDDPVGHGHRFEVRVMRDGSLCSHVFALGKRCAEGRYAEFHRQEMKLDKSLLEAFSSGRSGVYSVGIW